MPDGGLLTKVVRADFDAADKESSVAFRPWRRGYRATLVGRHDAILTRALENRRAGRTTP